jgi:hypothetical protein
LFFLSDVAVIVWSICHPELMTIPYGVSVVNGARGTCIWGFMSVENNFGRVSWASFG